MAIRDMVARHSDFEETDDFIPTPPWATRVLYEYVAPGLKHFANTLGAHDPACGQGHMLQVFQEYGHAEVSGSDFEEKRVLEARDRLGPGPILDVMDYVHSPMRASENHGVIITNPPYKQLNAFIDRALSTASFGVGVLCRVQALEGEKRLKNVFGPRPPTQIAFFSNRIPFKTGTVVKKAPKMFFHVWLWWEFNQPLGTLGRKPQPPRPPLWVPYDAQTQLEKPEDYVK